MSNKEKILSHLLKIVPNPERWEIIPTKISVRSYRIYYITKQHKRICVETIFVLPFLPMEYIWMIARLVENNVLKKVCKLKRR